jgi:membrane-associated PAP2 superfamily phosphatase
MNKINKLYKDHGMLSPDCASPGLSGAQYAEAVTTAHGAIPRSWWIAPMLLLAGLIMLETTGTDRAVSDWFFDAGTQTFPWRHTYLLDTVLHHWTKYLVVLITCVIAAALGFTYLAAPLRPWRRLLLFLVLAITLSTLTVTVLKQLTDRPCPWDLVGYGGGVPYTHLFATREPSHARGLCFPAGHAATGFALLAFFFAAYHQQRIALARTALLVGTFAGIALGIGRVAQGAHFVSHVLWSGLVCWLVMVGLYALLMTPRRRIPDTAIRSV